MISLKYAGDRTAKFCNTAEVHDKGSLNDLFIEVVETFMKHRFCKY